MYYPSLKEFLKLSKKANLIPVYKEISADLDTPVSAFLKIKKDGYAFLFESVEGQEKIARYSFLGTNPALIFRTKAKNIQLVYPGRKSTLRFVTSGDPLDELKKIMKDFEKEFKEENPELEDSYIDVYVKTRLHLFIDK